MHTTDIGSLEVDQVWDFVQNTIYFTALIPKLWKENYLRLRWLD